MFRLLSKVTTLYLNVSATHVMLVSFQCKISLLRIDKPN